MDDFIFKVPKLPEDSFYNKRRANNFNRPKNENPNISDFRGERSNPLQVSLFDRRNLFGNHSQLQPLREGIQEDMAQPSTSRCRRVLESNNNQVGIFHGVNEIGFNRSHNLINRTMGNDQRHSVFNTVNLPRMPHSVIGDRGYGNCFNSSSSTSILHSSNLSSNFKNSFHQQSDLCRGMNSVNFFDESRYTGGNSMGPLHSSLSMSKTVFGTETFPRKFGVTRDTTMNETGNNFNSGMSTFDSLNRASTIHRDSNIMLNASQNVLDNQSIMKSVLKMSLISVKEKIMNKLENLGHALLRNAPEMESSFTQAAKDIKIILENSTLVNPVPDATGMMSFFSYTSGAIGPQQSILHGETDGEQFESIKKPSHVLQDFLSKKNKNPKFELIKSFTVEKKKKKNINCEDLCFDEITTMENTNYTSNGSDDKKELNLRNWYPIFQKNSLALIGYNDENAQIQTETVKKRINNRRVLLDNGGYCNLIGNPSNGENFPTSVTKKIKNGFDKQWRLLPAIFAKFQKSTPKENGEIMEADVSTTTEFETSFNTTVMTRRSTELLKNRNANNGKIHGKESKKEKDNVGFISPKPAKTKGKSTKEADNGSRKRESGETRAKAENNGKKRSRSPIEKQPVKIQKTESTKRRTIEEPVDEDPTMEQRVLCTTKSGRVVKRPKDIFNGDNSKENKKPRNQDQEQDNQKTAKSKEQEERQEEKVEQSTKTRRPAKNARVRNVKEKPEVKPLKSTVNSEPVEAYGSPVATKPKGKSTKKAYTSKSLLNGKCNNNHADNPWGNDIDGLDDIIVPNISIHQEEIITDPKKLKLLSIETPPLKNIRSNFTFLKNYTPVQSPDWQISQHTRSAVKKFEKLRAQAFKTKIPKENATKKEKKSNNPVRSNKDVDTVLNWISEREVRSPKKCSNLINYILPKRNELEDEEENSGHDLRDEEEL